MSYPNKDTYAPPPNPYAAPPPAYGGPPSAYSAPQSGYGAPASGYGAPASGYGAAPSGYCAPQPGPTAITVNVDFHHEEECHDGRFHGPFSDKAIRQGFIRKVFSILSVQLLITAGVIAIFMEVTAVTEYVQKNIWVFVASIIGYLVFAIVLICCKSIRRLHPHNIILLILFTLCTSIMLGVVCSTYTAESVLLAFGICVICCTAVTIFAFNTKYDFTTCYGWIFLLLVCLMCSGLVFAMFPYSPLMNKVYAGIGALVFMIIMVADIHYIMGGRFELSAEEYVFGALQLYLDIINIFIRLLAIVGQKK